MRRIYLLLLGTVLALTLQSFLGFGKDKNSQEMKDLKKKTVIGLTIPYVIRYDTDDWEEFFIEGEHVFESRDKQILITVKVNKSEKNMSNNELIESFKQNIVNCFSDKSLYENIEFKPSDNLVINGIELLYTSALVYLKPNSVHFVSSRGSGYTKKHIGERGSTDQFDRYTYSGGEGWIIFSLESQGEISQEDQAKVAEFFRGFSFDGSACRGPPKLRRLKTIFEAITDELS